MKLVFWLSLGGVLYAYVGYPAAMWLLARLRPHRWSPAPITPTVSVILAVHNGIERLPAKIKHLLALDYAKIKEIIVVSDGSTDGTAEYLSSLESSQIKTVILREHVGKSTAVNAGVALATGEVILFVDIRPEIAPGAIQRLVSHFGDAAVGCVAGELVLRHEDHDPTASAVGGIYWRYEQWIRNCEAAFDSPVGVYGGFYAIRRELFTIIPDGLILDDMFQPLSIIRQGHRSVLDRSAFVYDVWPKKVEGEFHRKVRTLAGNFQLFQVAPWTLTPQNRTMLQLISHKAVRLIVPYLLVLLFVSTMLLSPHSWFFAAFGVVQVLGWMLAFAGFWGGIGGLQRISAPAAALAVLNAAAVVGLYKFLFTRGPLWKIWNTRTAESAKGGSKPEAAFGETAGRTIAIETDDRHARKVVVR